MIIYQVNLKASSHSFLQDTNTITSEIPVDYCQKSFTNFQRQSLRCKLISTLNETSNELLEMAKTLSQKNFMNFVRNEILTGYRYTCELLICHVCKRT